MENNVTKQHIHQRFVEQLKVEVEAITAAARSSFDTATNSEHQAKSKYETFSLETSYLARGQAKRAEELREALESLQMLPLKALDATTPIVLSALVRLRADNGETRTLFLSAAGGGEKITVDGEEIIMLTTRSPLGQAVLGKIVGDTLDIKIGMDKQTFTVTAVA